MSEDTHSEQQGGAPQGSPQGTPQGGQGSSKERPTFLTTLCILSYIGSGLWALLSLVGIFAANFIMSMLGGAAQSGIESAKESGDMSASEMEAAKAASESVDALAGMGSAFFTVIFVVSLIFAVLSLLGVAKMWKMQKSGFYIYTAVNGLIFLLALISVEIWSILFTGGFIAMYAANFKHLE